MFFFFEKIINTCKKPHYQNAMLESIMLGKNGDETPAHQQWMADFIHLIFFSISLCDNINNSKTMTY